MMDDTTADQTNDALSTDELSEQLRCLIHNREAVRGRRNGVQRCLSPFVDQLLSWCKSAGESMFHVDTGGFTAWGAPAIKVALASLLEYENERLPVELMSWVRNQVVPAVFMDSPMTPLHQEIAHIIVQCLLRPATIVGCRSKPIKNANEEPRSIKRKR